MGRLNIEREMQLSPKRIEYALAKIKELNLEILSVNKTTIEFIFNEEKIKFFPYSGWHSGKTIQDGRGIEKLLKQLKQS